VALFLFFRSGDSGNPRPTSPTIVSPPPSPAVSGSPAVSETSIAEPNKQPVPFSLSPEEVTDVKFYEGGFNDPTPKEQRQYTNSFYQGSVRYIYWELTLQTPRQEGGTPVTITAVWARLSGDSVAHQDATWTIPANSDSWSISEGWGNQNGGAFQPGMHQVAFFCGGRLIATGAFGVLPGTAESAGGPGPDDPSNPR
jgi:hypothetical protein